MMHKDSVLYIALDNNYIGFLRVFTIQKVAAYSPCLLLLLFIYIKYRVQIKVWTHFNCLPLPFVLKGYFFVEKYT